MEPEVTYTDVLCDVSEELIHALNQTPRRYIPPTIETSLSRLMNTLYNDNEHKKTVTSTEVEGEAIILVERLGTMTDSIPNKSIVSHLSKLKSVIKKHGNKVAS